MRALPKGPYAFQARVMSAMMDDLFDLGAGRAKRFERMNALRAASKATDEREIKYD